MSPEEPGQDPENPPLLPFSQLYPDLFAHLTPDQAQAIDRSLSSSRLEGHHHTRADVADLIAAVTGRISVDEYKRALM